MYKYQLHSNNTDSTERTVVPITINMKSSQITIYHSSVKFI